MYFSKCASLLIQLFSISCLAILLSACEKAHTLGQKIHHAIFKTEENLTTIPMVANVKVIRDVSYGPHARHRMDIYAPEQAKNAPVLVILHGGGWTSGEKDAPLIYINKVNRWVPKGFIVISVETRLMPEADVYAQIADFAQAVAEIQKNASTWGANSDDLMLMGHSSGGTIASVLSANPTLVTNLGGKPWLATFSLDSSSLDIARTMRLWKPDMFSYAYGGDAKKWANASPYDLVNKHSIPMFIACSTFRPDSSCEQAQLFKEKADTFNMKIEISAQKLNHGEINDALGTDSAYTKSAEAFMASLDPRIARLLNTIN